MPGQRRTRQRPPAPRAWEGGMGLGKQPPLLVDVNKTSPLPPPTPRDDDDQADRQRLAGLLRSHGVKVWVIALRLPAAQTQGALDAWTAQRDAGEPVGPGLLFRYVEAGVAITPPVTSPQVTAGDDAADLWAAVLPGLRPHVTPANWSTYLEDSQGVGWAGPDTLVVRWPNDFGGAWAAHRLAGLIRQCLADAAGRPVDFQAEGQMERAI